MKIELNYSQKHPIAQLFHFFLLFGLFLFIGIFADFVIIKVANNLNVTNDAINLFKTRQLISQIIIFLFPALMFGYYYSDHTLSHNIYLNFFSKKMWIWILILFVLAWPIIDLSSFLNYKIFSMWGNFDAYLKQQDAEQNIIIKRLITFTSPFDFIFSIFITGVIPAISEELFFRSIINKIIFKLTKKIWLSIFLTGLIFAVLHFHFYGLLPRIFMGMLFSFLLFYTQSVYPGMFIHCLFNSIQLIAAYVMGEKYMDSVLANNNLTFPLYISLITLLLFIVVIRFLLKRKNMMSNGI